MGGETEIPDDLDGYNDHVDRMRNHEYVEVCLCVTDVHFKSRLCSVAEYAATVAMAGCWRARLFGGTYADPFACRYPMLRDSVYLDHAGTTLYSKSLMERFHTDMMANLYGNPHSASPSSQRSTQNIEDTRLRLLNFFNADPEHFDLIFTANGTAAIKLVGDAFCENEDGFSYAYHVDSHTSLVGLRELSKEHRCLDSDVEEWIKSPDFESNSRRLQLFAYPAQSNMNGRRLPLDWCRRITEARNVSQTYTLLDAAAYASTSQLELREHDAAPDFTALSLYKIFGFPDLGCLIVKKRAGHIFDRRRYFGGGTVEMVACLKEQWHAKKSGALHERLEDGTLPVHSIVAAKSALQIHAELFGTLDQLSSHTAKLAKELHDGLSSLKHANGSHVCSIYKHDRSEHGDTKSQGPIIAFNLRGSNGDWVSNTEVEKLASIKNIHLRTGGVCNPGGIATALGLAPWQMRENFSAGHRCGSENDILHGKPTGVIRVSLGAMSTMSDVKRFIAFVDEFFIDRTPQVTYPLPLLIGKSDQRFHVESLTVYPIKSCGGWQVPYGQSWDVRSVGLAWDREWCVVHQGTGKALSQKQRPRMALIRPILDFKAGSLRVTRTDTSDDISVPLSKDPSVYVTHVRDTYTSVCGDSVNSLTYVSGAVAEFFTRALGVPCTLARHSSTSSSSRHAKPHVLSGGQVKLSAKRHPLVLSNESPVLTISRSSLNRLNEHIKSQGGKAAHASVFRANIVLAESPLLQPGQEQPWAEDSWDGMRIGGIDGPLFDFLGGCRRCQMVCVDQESAEKNGEPFVTLAKKRRFDGRVLFGVHTALAASEGRCGSVRAGDTVETFNRAITLDV